MPARGEGRQVLNLSEETKTWRIFGRESEDVHPEKRRPQSEELVLEKRKEINRP